MTREARRSSIEVNLFEETRQTKVFQVRGPAMMETTAPFRTMKLSNIGSGQDSSEMGDHLETTY